MARHRKPGKRTKSGRLSRAYADPEVRDHGTQELRAKRQAIVGEAGDPMLSATAAGILHAHGHLDREQYAEALEYGRLWCILYGTPWPTVAVGPSAPEDRIAIIKQRLNDRVFSLTEEQKRVITDVAVFNRIPTWFFCLRIGLKMLPEDEKEITALGQGLNIMLGRKGASHAPYQETLGARFHTLILAAVRERDGTP